MNIPLLSCPSFFLFVNRLNIQKNKPIIALISLIGISIFALYSLHHITKAIQKRFWPDSPPPPSVLNLIRKIKEYLFSIDKIRRNIKTAAQAAKQEDLAEVRKLAKLSDDELNLKIAFLNRFKRNPRAFIGSPTEELVLNKIGYAISDYQNRTRIFDKVQQLIEEKLNSKDLENQSLADCKKEVRWKVYIERFKIAGVDPSHIKHIEGVIKGMWNYRKKFDEIVKPYKDLHILNGSCEIAKKICKSEITGVIYKLQKNEIDVFIQENRRKLFSMFVTMEVERFQEQLQKLINDSINDPRASYYRKEKLENLEENIYVIQWLKENQDKITVQFSQGLLSDGDVLGDGICAGLTMRFLKMVLDNPICSDEELGLHEALPIDRFMQVVIGMRRKLDANFLPRGYKEYSYQLFQKNNHLKNRMLNLEGVYYLKLLSEPGISEIPGHALGLQIDRQNRIFRFYDPNMGIVRIKLSNQENPEVGVEKLVDALEGFLYAFYPYSNFLYVLINQE